MAIRVTTTGQTTFVKKVVIGTPVRSVTGTGATFTTLNDVSITNPIQNQIITFDSSTQKFINNDSATLVNLTLSGKVGSNLVPAQDSTFDLGDSAFKWKDLYLSGNTIHLGGLLLKDSGTQFSVSDSAGTSVNFDLSGSTSQIRGMFSAGGDLSYNSTSGEFSFDVENVYTQANFESDLGAAIAGGTGITYDSSSDTISLTNTSVTAATYGSATQVPQIAVNAQGQITSASNIAVAGVSSTAFDSASGIFTINTADGGSFNSKIADSSFTSSRARDVLNVVDAGGDGSLAYDSALGKFTYTGPSASEVRAHLSGGTGVTYTSGTGEIKLTDTSVSAATYGSASQVPQIAINAQGQITSASNVSVAGVTSTTFDSASGIFTINTADGGVFNAKIADSSFTSSRARDVLNVVDAGGDGSFAYDSALGKFTYTGPSASEVRAHLSGGTGITYNSGTGAITTTDGDIVHDNLSGFVSNEHIDHTSVSITAGAGLTGGGTIASTRTVDIVGGKGITANANDIQVDSGNIKNMFSGGTGITYSSGTGEFTTTDGDIVHDNLSGFVADEHIAHSGVSITAGAGLTGGGTIAANRTINVVGGKGITANADDIQVDSANLVILARNALSGSNGITYSTSTGDIRAPQPLDSAANPTFNQLRGPATFVIDPAGIGDSSGTVRILGNLTVEGTTTTINSVDVSINEKTFTIADSAADSADLSGAGIFWGGASIVADKPSFQYNHTDERFDANRTINADAFIGVGSGLTSLNGSNIASGTVAAARIDNLNTSKINAGVFDSARVPAIEIDANRITSGTIDNARISLDAAEIPSLATSKITSGVFDSARIPVLATSDITSGTLDSARLPVIAAANLAAKATALATARNIDVTGVTATGVNFDGTGDIDIEVTAVPASLLTGTIDNARISLDAAEIPNLATSKITSGVFDSARVPILEIGAGNVTSGAFADARIPSLAASKITSGSFANDISFDSAGGILFDLSDKALEFGPSYKISGLKTTDSAILGGDGSTGGVTISDGMVDIRSNTGHVSKVKFYCEVSNAHFQTLQAAPHSAGSSAVIVLPTASGTLLNTDGSGASLTSLNASQLGSGTVPSDRLSLSASDIPNLATSKITSGVFDSARVPILEIGTGNITSGSFADARIPNLATSKITSGVFDSARVPILEIGAGNVTSGAFADARIPNLAASKITSGILDSARIPPGLGGGGGGGGGGGIDSAAVLTVAGTGVLSTSGTAAIATSITASANNSTNESVFLAFVDGATGTQGIETDTSLTYNPSTNILTIGTSGDTLTLDDGGTIIASGTSLKLRSASGVLLQHDDVTMLSTSATGIDVEGSITVGSGDTFVLNGSETTTSATTQVALVTLTKTTYGAAKFLVTAVSSSERHITEIYATHDGTTGVATEYGTVSTNGILATYDVDINSNDFRLLATPASSTSTTFKVVQTLIEA